MSAARERPERFDVLDVPVSAIDMRLALEILTDWIERGRREYVCITGVHGVMECRKDPELLAIHENAGLVTPDGVPLTWVARMQGRRDVARVYGPDLMLALSERSAERGWRQYYYGGGAGTAEALADALTGRFPQLTVAGTETPPFRALEPHEEEEMAARINAARPDIVWVGLSTPKQERWMARHRMRLAAPLLIGVGAAFDFHSGTKTQAPPVMRRNGLEWLYRALTEPRRLGPRYARIVPAFLYHLTQQRLAGGSRKR